LELILKNICLDDYNALRLEYLIPLNFSFAKWGEKYKFLSSAVGSPGSIELRMGTKNAIVLPDPLAALIRMLNFFLSGFTVTSKVSDCTLVGLALPSSKRASIRS
jgi:hypothetical protein